MASIYEREYRYDREFGVSEIELGEHYGGTYGGDPENGVKPAFFQGYLGAAATNGAKVSARPLPSENL